MGHYANSIPTPRLWRTLFALAAVYLIVGGANVAHAQAPANKMCPVMTLEEADPAFTTVYEGKTIAFCCERCLGKFKANPERYAANLAAILENRSDQELAVDQHQSSRSNEMHEHEHDAPPSSNDKLADEHASEQSAHGRGGENSAEHAHNQPGQNGAGEQSGVESVAEHEHDHAASASGFARLIGWLGRFHPPVVHFPIAMLFGAAVAELLWMLKKRELFALAGRFCLWFGGLTALLAGVLGWFFAGFQLSTDNWILSTHRWLGTATVLWALATFFVGECTFRSEGASKRTAYRAMLLVSAIAVLVTGFFGGAMIYGIDHFT